MLGEIVIHSTHSNKIESSCHPRPLDAFFSHPSFFSFCRQSKDVTEALHKVAEVYNCKLAEGVLTHQMKQFVIDANKVVLSVGNADTRVDDFEFEEHEVYGVDIVMSTGEGKVTHAHPSTPLYPSIGTIPPCFSIPLAFSIPICYSYPSVLLYPSTLLYSSILFCSFILLFSSILLFLSMLPM